jgi:NADH-quinone oxidoreductase subunit G
MSGADAKAVDMVNIEIDGVAMQTPKGSMIIHAADDAGIVIPRFCYHKKLPIAANCRMCLVEVDGVPKPLPACATPVNEGMKVYTKSPLAIKAQRGVMEFLLINHPLDCPICDQGGECELQDVAMGYGRDISRFTEKKRVVKDKNIGPLIATEMTRCIHCTRCIRTLEVVGGVKELGATGRGMHTEIGTYVEQNVNSEMSGNVIDVCPVGALTSKPFRFRARAWEIRQHNSVAPHDCVGSNLHVHTFDNKVMRVVPADNEQVNECWISDRDRFSYQGLNSEQRLQQPMIKVNGVWQETDWESALDAVVEQLNEIRISDGDEQVGALVSPSATVEEMYLLQKLLRGLGVNSIDHRLRQTDFSDQHKAPVYPWLGQDIEKLEQQDAVLLIGSNIRKDQPIIGHRLRKAASNGASIMLVNNLDYEFTFMPAAKIIAGPAVQVQALAGIVRAVAVKTGKSVPAEFENLLADVQVSEQQRDIAECLVAADKASVLLGSQSYLSPYSAILRNLAMIISDLAGCKMGYLTDGANTSGAWLTGVLPHRGPAGADAASQGQHAANMLAKPMKAYLLYNVEPDLDCADPRAALTAMRAAKLVISFTSFRSPALEACADVMIPVSPFTETSGTFVNVEGRWQSFTGCVAPLGNTRPGWKILRVLGNMFDLDGFEYMSSEDVLKEIQDATAVVQPDNVVQPVAPENLPQQKNLVRFSELSIYSVDGITRRAEALQQTHDATGEQIHMNSATVENLGLSGVTRVLVKQADEWVSLPLAVDERMPDNYAMVPAAVSVNEQLGGPCAAIEVQSD